MFFVCCSGLCGMIGSGQRLYFFLFFFQKRLVDICLVSVVFNFFSFILLYVIVALVVVLFFYHPQQSVSWKTVFTNNEIAGAGKGLTEECNTEGHNRRQWWDATGMVH